MPVTKTATRALRASKRKRIINDRVRRDLEVAFRIAKRDKTTKSIKKVAILADRAAKTNIIHKNKASRIKSSISKLAGKAEVFVNKKSKKTKKNSKKIVKKK